MNQFITTIIEKQQALQQSNIELELYKEEKDYIEKNELFFEESKLFIIEKEPMHRFAVAYIERSNKETEEVIAIENGAFLNQSVHYLKEQKNEFIYLESRWFDLIGVDAISLEVDDVFGTYDVMLGLKLQKKYEKSIKNYLNDLFDKKQQSFDLMFNQNDGMWDLNFTLNFIQKFDENMTLGEAYCNIYRLLFNLAETIEETSIK